MVGPKQAETDSFTQEPCLLVRAKTEPSLSGGEPWVKQGGQTSQKQSLVELAKNKRAARSGASCQRRVGRHPFAAKHAGNLPLVNVRSLACVKIEPDGG